MVVYSGNFDSHTAQGFQCTLQFSFQHGEIVFDDGFVIAAGKHRPGIHSPMVLPTV
jgi:hypothetical protein